MSMKPITLGNLKYAFEKLKDFFVQIKDAVLSVNGSTPDEFGDVAIRRVDYAGDIESSSTQVSSGEFIQRTTGGTASIETGDAWLAQVYGNAVHLGYTPESIEMTVTPISQVSPIEAEIDEDVFRSKMSGSGTVTFTYTTNWNIDPTTYGITVTGTPAAGDQIVVVYVAEVRGTIYNATPMSFVSTGWNLYSHSLGYAKVVKYTDADISYRVDGTYTALKFSPTLTGQQEDISVVDSCFSVPSDGYVFVTGGSGSDTSIAPTWEDWIEEANGGVWEGYSIQTVDLSGLFDGDGAPFPAGLCRVGTARDEINISLAQAISRIEVIPYSPEALAEAKDSGRDYDVDSTTIYLVRANPVTSSISISGSISANDHGIEYFTDTDVAAEATLIYGTNLRNKLERDVLTISAQTLTSAQQGQVRGNIGAASAADLTPTEVSTGITNVNAYKFGKIIFIRGSSLSVAVGAGKAANLGYLPTELRPTGANFYGIAFDGDAGGRHTVNCFVMSSGYLGVQSDIATTVTGLSIVYFVN
jgi:hypothetical protein